MGIIRCCLPGSVKWDVPGTIVTFLWVNVFSFLWMRVLKTSDGFVIFILFTNMEAVPVGSKHTLYSTGPGLALAFRGNPCAPGCFAFAQHRLSSLCFYHLLINHECKLLNPGFKWFWFVKYNIILWYKISQYWGPFIWRLAVCGGAEVQFVAPLQPGKRDGKHAGARLS